MTQMHHPGEAKGYLLIKGDTSLSTSYEYLLAGLIAFIFDEINLIWLN